MNKIQIFNNILTKYTQHIDKVYTYTTKREIIQCKRLFHTDTNKHKLRKLLGLELYSFGLYKLGIPPSKN